MDGKKPLLVTTDGSAHSHRVLPHAALLAKAVDAPLVLVQVLDSRDTDGERAAADARATLKRLGIEGEILIEPRQGRERTDETILRVARRLDAAALALDSRGHGALRHLLHGSVALELLKTAHLPLLVSGPNIEPPAPSAEPYRIVATCDGSPASEEVLRELGQLAGDARLEVTLLRVHEHEPAPLDNEAALKACREGLAEAQKLLPESLRVDAEVRDIPRGGGIDTAIIEKARGVGAHAIALSTHGHSARRHVVMGSVAMLLLGRSPFPLLLTRAV